MVIEHFNSQVFRSPQKEAIVTTDKILTYQELDDFSNDICFELLSKNISPGDIIPVIANRSWEFIAAILGVLKAGCLYMPIDPKTPEERIKFMFQDAKCKVVLYNCELQLTTRNIELVNIQTIKKGSNLTIREHDNAYVMYTSGSTGLPKGVIIKQKGIVRLVKDPDFITLSYDTKILFTGSIAFDASTFEIFASILNGGTLYILTDEILLDSVLLKEHIYKFSINTMWLTSPLFNQLIDTDPLLFDSCYLKYLLIGGDVLSPLHINIALRSNRDLIVINGYGPTENTTFSTTHSIRGFINQATVPIGKPINKSEVYVLTNELDLVKRNEEGEIYVGGEGLMEGYLNDESLTAQKMIPNPLKKGGKLYKTGDLGYWDQNGNLNFTGRKDTQIKINGYRIETNEIKYVINTYEAVSDSLVLYHSGQEALIAYIIANREFQELDLRKYLAARLPDYMIPHCFNYMEAFPLNSNGKIDLNLLSNLNLHSINKINDDTLEAKILKIYYVVLNSNLSIANLKDNFFDLGGNSMKIMKLLHEIEKAFGVKVPISDFFRNPTIEFLLEVIDSKTAKLSRKLDKSSLKELYLPSLAQKRLFFLQELNKENVSYNITSAFQVVGEISVEKIEAIFSGLVNSHEVLRTVFVLKDNTLYQKICQNTDVEVKELTGHPNNIDEVISAFVKPFDLKKDFFRLGIIQLSMLEKILVMDIHHCMLDGFSVKILMNEFYKLLSGEQLEKKEYSYKDYSEWQHSDQYKHDITLQKEFWTLKYNGLDFPVLELPTDVGRPSVFTFSGESIDFQFSEELTSKIKAQLPLKGVTSFMYLFSLFNLLLAKLSNLEDIVIGVPVSGRTHPDFEHIVGMFVNTLPFNVKVPRSKSFESYLKDVHNFTVEAFQNQDYPLEELINELKIDRDISRNPLFDVLFSFQDFNYSKADDLKRRDIKIAPYSLKRNSASYDITLIASEFDNKFHFRLEYYKDIFDKRTILKFIEIFNFISQTVADNPEVPIKNIKLGPDLNLNSPPYYQSLTSSQSIVSLFLEQVSKSPDKIAVILNNSALTYSELNKRALALAKYITESGIKREAVIAIRGERSPDLLVSMLGIMYAGCCYLPMDPSIPTERAVSILEASSAEALIIIGSDINPVAFKNIINITELAPKLLRPFCPTLPEPDSLAYIIYTSGSTGEPKGVAIRHKSIVNTLIWRKNYYNFSQSDVTLQVPSYFFDSSVEDIFTPLISGATLLMINSATVKNVDVLLELCYKNKVTNFLMIPSLYKEFLLRIKSPLNLRFVSIAGEDFDISLVTKHFDVQSEVELVNEYGPTECSVCATVFKFSKESNKVLIGKPIPGIKAYVLNTDMNICPEGIPGELYLSGVGLTRGYHKNASLTGRTFIPNPYDEGTLYRTGDIVKLHESGDLEFLGRADAQIKIHGFRIEIGEIESQIYQYKNIKEAVVIKSQSGDSLLAFINADSGIDTGGLKKHLESKLPSYMVPSIIKQLTEFPRTGTGKVNRKKLSEIQVEIKRKELVEPSTELEKNLLTIWKSIIQVKEVSVVDNFFESGGNSINILSFQNTIETELNIVVSVDKFFQYSNISKLADYCQRVNIKEDEVKDESIELLTTINLFDQD